MKCLCIKCVWFFVAVIAYSVIAQPEPDYDPFTKKERLFSDLYSDALNRGSKGDFEDAQEQFGMALSLFPRDNEAQFYMLLLEDVLADEIEKDLARLLFKTEKNRYDTEKQFKLVQTALRAKPDYALSYLRRGMVYQSKGETEKAIADFKRAVDLAPDLCLAHAALGKSFQRIKDHKHAIASIKKAIELDSTCAIPYDELASAYSSIGDCEMGMAAFQKYAGQQRFKRYWNDHVFVCYLNLGQQHRKNKAYDDAFATFNTLMAVFPDRHLTLVERGIVYMETKEYSKALTDFDRAIELNAESERAYYQRGKAHIKLKNFEDAVTDLERSTKAKPEDPSGFYQLAQAFSGAGNYEQAIVAYESVITLDPKHAWAYYQMAFACEKAGKYDDAIDAYLHFVENAPANYKQHIARAKDRIGVLTRR